MNKKLLLPLALVGVLAMGATAATGIGSSTVDRDSLTADRERVKLDVERVPLGSAGTASAITSAKKGKKPKILHFVAAEELPVPDFSEIASLACPGKAKLLSGDFTTNGGVVPDVMAAISSKRFEFGFISFRGDTAGTASLGIFCAKGVK